MHRPATTPMFRRRSRCGVECSAFRSNLGLVPRVRSDSRARECAGSASRHFAWSDGIVNVLFVLPWDQKRGGVTAVANNVASHLLGDGHKVWFLHPGAAEKPLAKITQTGMPGFDMKLRDPVIPERPLRGRGRVLAVSRREHCGG